MRRQTRSVVLLKVSRCQGPQQRNADMPTFAEQVADRTPKQHASTQAGGQFHTDPIWSELRPHLMRLPITPGCCTARRQPPRLPARGGEGGGGGGSYQYDARARTSGSIAEEEEEEEEEENGKAASAAVADADERGSESVIGFILVLFLCRFWVREGWM
jgi:hypothetical protein